VQTDAFDLLSAPDGGVCALWSGYRASDYQASVYKRCWTDGQWSEAERASDGDSNSGFAAAFAPDGSLQVATGAFGKWHFGEAELTPADATIIYLRLAIDTQGGYHVVWHAYEAEGGESLWYRYSKDSGRTWETEIKLTGTADAPQATMQPCHLVADRQGNVHLAWSRSGGIFYRRWTPDGQWAPAQRILPEAASAMSGSALAVDAQGQPYVMLNYLTRSGLALGYVTQAADGSWSDPQPVTKDSPGVAIWTDAFTLAVDTGGRKHFVWQVTLMTESGPPGLDLYYVVLP
jgi:hypothetical protein